jgi:putative endopeptidase
MSASDRLLNSRNHPHGTRYMPNLRPTTLALALTLVVAVGSPDAMAQKKKRAAAKKPVAEKIDACGDFYTYNHKAWLDSNMYVGGSGMTSAMSQLRERALQQQIDLLNANMQSAQGGIGKLLGDFWASGLDEAAVEADGANPIAPLLDRINGIKRDKDIAPAIAALHQVGIPALFNFSANVDLQDLDRHVGYFTQGGLGLPDPAWYTRSDADTTALFGRYQAYVKQVLTLTGSPADKVDADLAAVLDLEKRIAGISKPISLLRDPRANYALVPTADLGKQYRKLQLLDFLKAQGVTDDAVSMADPQLFAQLDALVDTLSPNQWKAYLRYQVGSAMAPYLSKAWRDADFEFRGRVLRGEAAPGTRQKQVLDAINLAAGPMLGRDYVTRHLPDATRARAQQVAGQVRDALGRGIDANTWMSAPTREQAKAKLAKLKIEIGAPARDLDYTVQPMGRGSFGGNMLIASTWRHREEMKRIGRGNAERRWDVLPQQPALAYDIAHNRLIVTAAMLQAPVLDMAQDPASHYGAYGALVGHELGHAFDNKGRMVDASGSLRDWWTPVDAAAWEARANQVAAQFNAYAYPGVPGIKVNGTLTRDENVADLGGVELAWNALQASQPGADGKAFYQGWAKLWPQQMSADVATLLATTDVHAPGQWRTNGPLINQPAFASAYGCKAASGMTLAKGQPPIHVWNVQPAASATPATAKKD